MNYAGDLVLASVGGAAGGSMTLSATRAVGTVDCSRVGVIWSVTDSTDDSRFRASFNDGETTCSATTTTGGAAVGDVVRGTFSATMIGIEGPREGQLIEITNGRFSIVLQ